MPMTIQQERARKKYITPKDCGEQFSISKAQVYKILARPEMQEAIIKMGTGCIRIDIDRAFEITQQIFR